MIVPLLGNWRVWIAAAVSVWALATYALYERGNAAVARLDTFKAQVEAVGQQAIARAKEKELENANRITAAITRRDVELARLRVLVQQTRSGGSVLPSNTGAAPSADRICFQRAGLDDALKQFIGSAAGIAEAGDSAIIDTRAWLQAWPK
jgi:hypothetical protein